MMVKRREIENWLVQAPPELNIGLVHVEKMMQECHIIGELLPIIVHKRYKFEFSATCIELE